MSRNREHHFVPKYYFKRFSGDGKRICVLLRRNGDIIPSASIRGQCAQKRFYGTTIAEHRLGSLERRHSHTLQDISRAADKRSSGVLNRRSKAALLEAIALQRARTVLEVNKWSGALEDIRTDLLKKQVQLRESGDAQREIIEALDSKAIRIKESSSSAVLRQISVGLENAVLLSDMCFRVLVNHTKYPFVFSDSPVVFCNTYYRNVTDRGVLGVQSPGLQVFFPLSSTVAVMLIDSSVYSGAYTSSEIVDLVECADVSHLNALQLHHSSNVICFGNYGCAEYVRSLYRAHKDLLRVPSIFYSLRSDLLVDGEKSEGGIMHTFEPQLNHWLELSFVTCDPPSETEYRWRQRSPALVRAVEMRRNNDGTT